jgi:ATP-dependent DNA helicase DinG
VESSQSGSDSTNTPSPNLKANFVSEQRLTVLCEGAFGPHGALSKAVTGYTERRAQTELSIAIAQAIEQSTQFVAEAGTGIGKTFAYLVPAMLSGQKVLISTGTKTLQDQLFSRDLPKLQAALGVQVFASLLKGRSNYVCQYHLNRNLNQGRFERASDGAQLRKIQFFAARSNTGDRADCHEVEESSEAWAYATSTKDNCLGQECPDWERCFVIKARKQAQAADIVVINHHLYCADSALKEEGVAELLPSANVLIFDEAHQLPETCVQFFGSTISSKQILELTRDTLAAGLTEARDALDWQETLAPLERAARDLRLAWPQGAARLAGAQLGLHQDFGIALGHLLACLTDAVDALAPQAIRGPNVERCVQRAMDLQKAFQVWTDAYNEALLTNSVNQSSGLGDPKTYGSTNTRSPSLSAEPEEQGANGWDDGDGPQVCWAQSTPLHLSLHLTPLYIGRIFARRLQEAGQQAVVFLSATLAVDGRFEFFKRQLGLQDAQSQAWQSPFEYARNAALYLPAHLGDPNGPDFTVRLLQETWPLLQANKGRAFLLFTTLRAVKKAADWLRIKLPTAGFKAELLVQGEISKSVVLERFRSAQSPILVGSASFWEGVDVVGDQLSLVIIDKIPFAPPDDPMLQARVETLKKRGIDPFSTLQLPAAAISMKQGAGRLIRSETDRGLLVIGDVRLQQKSYGKRILRSLPPFKQVSTREEAMAFLLPDLPPAAVV